MKTAIVLCVLGLGLAGASLVEGTVVLDEAEAREVTGGACVLFSGEYACDMDGPSDCNYVNGYYFPCQGTGQCIKCTKGDDVSDNCVPSAGGEDCALVDTRSCGNKIGGLCESGECTDMFPSQDPCDNAYQCLEACP